MYCSTNQIKTRFTIQSYESPPQRRALSNAISEASHASKKTFQSAIKSIGENVPKNVGGLKEKSKFFISTHGLEDLSESSKHFFHHHKNLHSSPSPPKSILRNLQQQSEIHHSFSPPKRVSSRVSFQKDQNQIKRKSQSKSNPNKAESRYFIGNLHKVEEHFSGSKNKGKQDFPIIEPFGEGTSKSTAARKRPHNSSPVSSTGSATHQPSQRLQRQPSKSQMSQSKISRNEQNRSQRKSSHNRERGREMSGGGDATTMGGGGGEAVNQSEQQQSEKPLKGIAKVAKHYPFLGFAATGSTMIIGTTAIVTHNLHSKEDEVMRKKKELGLPPVDLEKEKKNAEAKLRQKLGQSSQITTPPPTTQQTITSPSTTTTTKKTSPSSPPTEPSPSGKSGTGH